MTVYVGIDPGKCGGVARIRNSDLQTWRTPVDADREYDIAGMKRVLDEACHSFQSFVVVERAQAFPRFKDKRKSKREERCPTCKREPQAGSVSNFGYGYGYGIWIALLVALEIPHQTVHPAAWSKVMTKGAPGEGKHRNIWTARKRFPAWHPCNPTEELAVCDAILLAEYGRITQTHAVFSRAGELDLEYA